MRVLFLLLMITCLAKTSIADSGNNDEDLKSIRKQLLIAIDDEHVADSLYAALDGIKKKTPVTVAYLGALNALKAKHTWNPYSKIKYLNESEKKMQQAVTEDPYNIEILFMRFSIQYNVPGFLGYGKNLVADREEMIRQLNSKNYGTADSELTITIIKFLLDSKKCTPQQSDKLHLQLRQLS